MFAREFIFKENIINQVTFWAAVFTPASELSPWSMQTSVTQAKHFSSNLLLEGWCLVCTGKKKRHHTNLLVCPFYVYVAWSSHRILPLPVSLQVWQDCCEALPGSAEVGCPGFPCSWECSFPGAGRLRVEVACPKHCHVNKTPGSFPAVWGTQRRWLVVLEDAITHLILKWQKRNFFFCATVWPHQAPEAWIVLFSLLQKGELCPQERSQSRGCFIVGGGCITSWDA